MTEYATAAQKIAAWREQHPRATPTYGMLCDILERANLRYADLRGADLRGAYLPGADMRGADMRGANLWDADLWDVNFSCANLRHANLRSASLWGAVLWGADRWGGLPVQAGASGDGYLIPTPDGWRLSIGCWRDRTLDDLDDLIADRTTWPEATGAEKDRRRPMLRAVFALCEAHIGQHEGLVEDLAEKWTERKEDRA